MPHRSFKVSLGEFKTLLPYLARYRMSYIWGFACLITVDAAQVIIPQFMRRAIDMIVSGSFTGQEIGVLCAGMVGVMALISLGRFLWRYFIHGSSRRIEREIRETLFKHLLTLSYDFYQNHKIGDLMARATNDLNAVRMSIGLGLVALVDGTIMAASILVIIFIQDGRTAAFAVLPLPFITALMLFFGGALGNRFKKAQETYAAMSDTVQETFAGIRVVKSFVKEGWFIKKFADTNDDYREANMALVKLYGAFFPLIVFLSGLTTVIVLLVGGSRVVEGFMSPGDLLALFRYVQMLIWPLMGAGFTVNMIQRGAVSLKRVNEILETAPSITSPRTPQERPAGQADALIIRDLSFAYPEGREVLKGVSFTIKQGMWVGILGRTGSGKSTLIKAITRMIDPPAGTVLVKGMDVRDWDLKELRACFGVTPQDSYLFSDSIRNNILYGLEPDTTASSTEPGEGPLLKHAAALAALDRDLESFAQGADTLIGERGLTLSGGQKQRTAIARALIGEPEFLILDDALSAVDAETEKRILTGLLAERAGKTTIIVSHRVSTLGNADYLLVLDQGRITEAGTPLELTARGGFYARMAALQQLDQGEPSGIPATGTSLVAVSPASERGGV
ncbi:MAG: ABC transporter ATP-binding protein/permease [Treponema sp.]|jgi:ATP-binding cassette subfamily B protein|nr:ABC transporter ATP-binding protein/permease [Treponema sp.]